MESKKNPKLDYRKKSGLFFNIGLVISLLFVISAFEWKFAEHTTRVGDDFVQSVDEILDVPVTEQKVEPPKPKVVPNIIEVLEEDPLEVDDINYTWDQFDMAEIEEEIYDEKMPDEEVEEIFDIVQTMPSFDGGLGEFYKFLGRNLIYPDQARRLGVEGKVYVHFVIDKDGSLSDIKIVRGIGAGCDEEVLRIVNMSPPWNPGKQRGNPVRVRMMLPINFVLE